MRLVTHNLLKCNIKGVANGYPLVIEPERVEVVDNEFNKDMVVAMLKRINLDALKLAAENIGNREISGVLALTEAELENEELLRRFHHLLFEVIVLDGNLVCPESGRKFPIKEGIPNMLLREDEV